MVLPTLETVVFFRPGSFVSLSSPLLVNSQAAIELLDRFAANAIWRDLAGDDTLSPTKGSGKGGAARSKKGNGSIRRRSSGMTQYNYFAIVFDKIKDLYHAYNGLLRRATEMAGEKVRDSDAASGAVGGRICALLTKKVSCHPTPFPVSPTVFVEYL